MRDLPGGEQKLFEAFLKSTQYLLRLQSQQDIWEHLGRFVLTHFPADWLAFAERDSGDDLSFRYSTLPKGVSAEQILTSEVRALLSDVLDSGFLATRVLPLPTPSMTVFLPIVENGRASRVMVIGHRDAQPLPSGLLGIYLALAGLAGTTTERKRAEEEVRRLNAELERRVEERTMQLQSANEELQREIAEHKRAEKALQEGRAILDAALASMTDAVFISDTKGRFVEFNEAFATFHKFKNKAECASSLSEYPDILDVFTADGEVAPLEMWAVSRALRGETTTSAEYRLRRKDSGESWVGNYSFGPIRDANGAITGAVVVGRDVTEQKQAEAELRKSKERLNLALEVASVGEWEIDLKLHTGSRSRRHAEIFGYDSSAADWSFESFINHVLPEHRVELAEKVKASLISGVWEFETQIRRADGEIRWIWARGCSLLDETGKPARMYGTVMDITDRKRAEDALRESEEQLQLFIEHAPAALAMFDREMRYLRVSRCWMEEYGLGDRNVTGLSHYEVFPEITEEWKAAHRRGLQGEVLAAEADRFERADGSVQWIRWEIRPWYDATGAVGGILIFTEDITQNKRSEEALRESELRYRLLFENNMDAIFLTRTGGTVLAANPAACAMFNTTEEEFCRLGRKWTADPEDPRLSAALEERERTGRFKGELTYLRPNGTKFIGEVNSVLLPGAGLHFAILRDITERKQAEEALRASEERLRLLGDNLPESYVYQYTYEADGRPRFMHLSAGVEKLHGVKASDVLRDASILHNQIEQEQYAAMAAAESASLKTLTDFEMELQMCRSDGQWRWFHLRSRPRRKADGQFLWDGVATDITERKRVQEQLRESEVLYHNLFNSMVEAFCIVEVILDREGKAEDFRFVEVNPAFEKQTGLREVVGKRMGELVPGNEAYWCEIYGRIALTGEAAHFENEAKALNRYYEVRAYRVGKAELRHVAIVFNDISGRKRADEALHRALEEKTALLKEVHHRVKNNLQIVSSLLNLQTRQVTNEAALDTLRDTQGRIRAMALLHETLYRENNNGQVNSSVYFSHLCAHLCRAFGQMGERVQVRMDIAPVELGLDVAIPCGLIINELVSNSFKHAFPGGRGGEIVVKLGTGAAGMIHLSVADDGVGLSPGADYQHGSTLGTQLVAGLAKQVAGTLEVQSDGGTKVQVSFLNPEKGGRSYE